MDKKELLNMANNPDFIPGIYNYCDRWCERCLYTKNCLQFATEKKQFSDQDSHDINQEEFWENMGDIPGVTFEILEEAARNLDIDLNDIDTEELKTEDDIRTLARQERVAVYAHEYATMVKQFFDENPKLIDDKGEELANLASLEIPGLATEDIAIEIDDSVEIIRWYQFLLCAKIMRALQGKIEEIETAVPIQYDYNGSAKVALVSIDRSVAAWGGILKTFPDAENAILALLLTLENVQSNLVQRFPNAHKFVRPGFDE